MNCDWMLGLHVQQISVISNNVTLCRLNEVEAAQNVKAKEQKKLDFKEKQLCKFAYLFNGEYDMCRHGFDEDMINAPPAEGLTAAGTHTAESGYAIPSCPIGYRAACLA